MKENKCRICSSSSIVRVNIFKNIYKCSGCNICFNINKLEVDYENYTTFNESDKQRRKWQKFAQRDYNLISKLFLKDEIKTVLDFGSGYGYLAEIIESNNDDIKVYNYELNYSMLKDMKERGLKTVNFESKKFDVVILNHCLEHIINPENILKLIKEKFDPNYLIFFQTNYKGFIPRYLPILWYGWSHKQHYYHFTPETLFWLVKKVNQNSKIESKTFYKLDQLIEFNFKGFIKSFLKILNFTIINGSNCDAFVISCKINK